LPSSPLPNNMTRMAVVVWGVPIIDGSERLFMMG
jgi:hypothetical protein